MITPFNNNKCPAKRLYNTPLLRFGERPFFYPAKRSEVSPFLAPPRVVPCVSPSRQPRDPSATYPPREYMDGLSPQAYLLVAPSSFFLSPRGVSPRGLHSPCLPERKPRGLPKVC